MTHNLYNSDSIHHDNLNNSNHATLCERAGVPYVIIPTSLVYQITDTSKRLSNRNLDTITHVASNQSKINEMKKRIEEIEFNDADALDELYELHELYNKCKPLVEAERNRPNKIAENLATSYRSRIVELTNMLTARKTELSQLKQQLMLEQQQAILECQANPPVLLTGEDIIANYYAHAVQEREDHTDC